MSGAQPMQDLDRSLPAPGLPMPPADRAALNGPGLGARGAAVARGRRILLATAVPDQKTAWTKARKDVQRLLREDGYDVVVLPLGADALGWARLLATLRTTLRRGGHLLIEYPFDQRKRIYPIVALARMLRVRLLALVHDLDSLRFPDSPMERELAILRLFDGVVSHNATMTRWLRDGGMTQPIVDLSLFDYRCDTPVRTWHEEQVSSPLKVACCGNLSWGKARYVYDKRLAALEGVQLDLYGAFFEADKADPRLRFRGVFDPDAPALEDRYHFGLVWDGTRVEQCDGSYGTYMRYNNPHKLSLYVALGLPVIVWGEAAIADLVQRCGIGVAVHDLREMGQIAARVSTADYQAMVRRLQPLTEAVRAGGFLRDALIRLQRHPELRG
jgi:hypothetical protein